MQTHTALCRSSVFHQHEDGRASVRHVDTRGVAAVGGLQRERGFSSDSSDEHSSEREGVTVTIVISLRRVVDR